MKKKALKIPPIVVKPVNDNDSNKSIGRTIVERLLKFADELEKDNLAQKATDAKGIVKLIDGETVPEERQ